MTTFTQFEKNTRTKNGDKVEAMFIKSRPGITMAKIGDNFNKLAQKYRDKGFQGKLAINVLFPSKDGRPAKWRRIKRYTDIEDCHFTIDNEVLEYWGKHAKEYLLHFPDKFHFAEFLIKPLGVHEEQGGGKDPHNDCFYNCLNEIIPDVLAGAGIPTPEALKKFLGLTRLGKVPISAIPKIEEELGVRINVYGENEDYNRKFI